MASWSGSFWKDTAERVIATTGEVALAFVPVDLANVGPELKIEHIAAVVGLTALASLLKCIVANAKNSNTGASFGTTVPAGDVAAHVGQDPDTDDQTLVAGRALRGVKDGTPVDVAPNRPGNWVG
jgi:hypothetical protein